MFNQKDNEFDNNRVTKLNRITVKRNPILDQEVFRKKHVDDTIGEGTTIRFKQTLENFLKVTDGSSVYKIKNKTESKL